MAKYKFKKFGLEGLRTDFKAFDSTTFKAPTAKITSRTAVVADDTTKVIAAGNITTQGAYLLAEDVLPTDGGIVYWIIEDTNNLEEEV